MKPKCLRSALYARNPALLLVQACMDAVHKARQVGKKEAFYAQKLDEFVLLGKTFNLSFVTDNVKILPSLLQSDNKLWTQTFKNHYLFVH
ncbi:Uncharacterised protein [Legionella lansingensis]|uniref:Uncharacterized protein n=1 Tax=Legionella lansingensis TaxID=45067 RepID=A0A0W0VUQ2_9GAMM|nr:hypothetical protein [Legionella lansingensis]KTD23762.1 hypothetical protein Llan_0543 [Legionella lansingensis]SNV47437.1 Uncharacterised protein [Legionella lansingensis]